MSKLNIAQVTGKLYDLLKDLEPDERQRVVASTLMLFGEAAPSQVNAGGVPANPAGGGNHIPKSFMDEKDPQNKGESLAVAARYLELYENTEAHTKEDFKRVFSDSRRNFDNTNFARDIKNVRNQSGYFNKNTGKGSDTLSYYGQNYVDALPDREKAKGIKRPKTKAAAKKKAKKTTAKKKTN